MIVNMSKSLTLKILRRNRILNKVENWIRLFEDIKRSIKF